MTATVFRQASDLTTRQQVWVSSVPSADPSLQGVGHPAARWAGVWGSLYAREALTREKATRQALEGDEMGAIATLLFDD